MKKKIIALSLMAILLVSLVAAAVAAACAHDWGWDIVRDSNCHEPGKKQYACSKCGAVQKTASIATKPHNYGDYTVVREATCQLQGLKERFCKNDRCGHRDTATIPRVQHNYQFVQVKTQPTCTQQGQKEYKCIWCPMHKYETIAVNPLLRCLAGDQGSHQDLYRYQKTLVLPLQCFPDPDHSEAEVINYCTVPRSTRKINLADQMICQVSYISIINFSASQTVLPGSPGRFPPRLPGISAGPADNIRH